MSAEMASEAMEVITMSVDKHSATKNYEVRENYITLQQVPTDTSFSCMICTGSSSIN
jgi:hypothetical protein